MIRQVQAALRTRRRTCRLWTQFYAWAFAVVLVMAPFVVLGESEPTRGIFGLPIAVERWAFNGVFLLFSMLLIRSINNAVKSINALHSNQRELAKVLTQLVTAHAINHGQDIAPPEITGGEEGV